MIGGIEVPSMDAGVARAEVAGSTSGEGSATRKSESRKAAKASAEAVKAAAEAAQAAPAVSAVEAMIASLAAERDALRATYVDGVGVRRFGEALQAATRDGRRSEHLDNASAAAYRVAEITGALAGLYALRRLASAAELRREAAGLRAAAERADAAVRGLKLDDGRAAKVARVIRGALEADATALERRAWQDEVGVKVDPATFNPADRTTWPARAITAEGEALRMLMKQLSDAQESV